MEIRTGLGGGRWSFFYEGDGDIMWQGRDYGVLEIIVFLRLWCWGDYSSGDIMVEGRL